MRSPSTPFAQPVEGYMRRPFSNARAVTSSARLRLLGKASLLLRSKTSSIPAKRPLPRTSPTTSTRESCVEFFEEVAAAFLCPLHQPFPLQE